jgi:hypothetical protein
MENRVWKRVKNKNKEKKGRRREISQDALNNTPESKK